MSEQNEQLAPSPEVREPPKNRVAKTARGAVVRAAALQGKQGKDQTSAPIPKVRKRKKGGYPRNRARITQDELYEIVTRGDKEIAEYIRAKATTGRPPKALDPRRILEYVSVGASIPEIAAALHVDEKTIDRAKKRDPIIRRMLEIGDDYGKCQLKSAIHIKAVVQKDNTMLVWASKNRLGWRDAPAEAKQDREIRLEVVYADNRSVTFALPPPRSTNGHQNGQEIQCGGVRPEMGEDHPGNGSADSSGASGDAGSVVLSYLPLPQRRVEES